MSVFVWAAIFAGASAVLACCVALVANRQYHAGLFGKVGLSLVAIAALSRLGALLEHGANAWVSPQGVLIWIGLALFLVRHTLRYFHRLMRGDPTWYPGR
jgi:hypothetical protein